MSDRDAQRQNAGHREDRPTSGFIGQAAQAAVSYCTLPDRRPNKRDDRWPWERWERPEWLGGRSDADRRQDCIDYRIGVKARENDVPMPAQNSDVYRHILRHIDDMTRTGIAQCQTRDFENSVDPTNYYGYRNAHGQCAITTNRDVADDARRRYPQTPRR